MRVIISLTPYVWGRERINKTGGENSIKLVPGNLKIYFRIGQGGNTKGVLTVKFAFNECGR